MVWIILLLCLGFVGAAGYYQGPIRAAFAFLGLLFGAVLAEPLSPLTQRLLELCGLHHPAWNIFAPQVLAFLIVLTIFKIAGQVVHQKVAVYFKYKVDDKTLYRWQRVYSRVGFSLGLLNGSFYFLLLCVLIYSAGYFTTEAATGPNDPGGARFLTETRAQLQSLNLGPVLSAYDMVPNNVYEASDTAALILHNPILLSRLEHYPPVLQLGERAEFKALGHDVQLQQLIASQNKIMDVLLYPQVHAMLTNAAIVADVRNIIAKDLDDLTNYLVTGQSAKYDPDVILGVWNINRSESLDELRKKPGITPSKFEMRAQALTPYIAGLSLTAMPDNQLILKKMDPNTSESTVVAAGTWKKDQDSYQVNLPGLLPETSEVEFEKGVRLMLPRSLDNYNYVLDFDKQY